MDGREQRVYEHRQFCTHCDFGPDLRRQAIARNPALESLENIPELDKSRLTFGEQPAVKRPQPKQIGSKPSSLKRITQEDIERAKRQLEKVENE